MTRRITRPVVVRNPAWPRPLASFGLVGILGGLAMAITGSPQPSAASAAETASAQQTSDEAAAAAIAAEMKKNAGQQGAVRTAAAHFAEQLESHHYPASPGDGIASGSQVAKAIAGSLPAYQKVVPDYRMDEAVSQRGNVVTITSYTSGTYAGGGRFDDVSQVAYQVHGGRITRADAVHTNPGAIQKAMRGSDERAAADHRSAETIAAEMRASQGSGLPVAQKYFAERIANWSPDAPQRNTLFEREMLRAGMARELDALKKGLANYANRETIAVEGNRILLDGKASGDFEGKPTWGDSKIVLYVTDGAIVGLQASHSPEGSANLMKVMKAAGIGGK